MRFGDGLCLGCTRPGPLQLGGDIPETLRWAEKEEDPAKLAFLANLLITRGARHILLCVDSPAAVARLLVAWAAEWDEHGVLVRTGAPGGERRSSYTGVAKLLCLVAADLEETLVRLEAAGVPVGRIATAAVGLKELQTELRDVHRPRAHSPEMLGRASRESVAAVLERHRSHILPRRKGWVEAETCLMAKGEARICAANVERTILAAVQRLEWSEPRAAWAAAAARASRRRR